MHATSMTNLKTLYVLRLAHRKWYVGTTGQSPRQRLATHQRGAGSAWTRTHPVQAMVHTMDVPAATAGILETAKTLELMRRHGVGNVRGVSKSEGRVTSGNTFRTPGTIIGPPRPPRLSVVPQPTRWALLKRSLVAKRPSSGPDLQALCRQRKNLNRGSHIHPLFGHFLLPCNHVYTKQ
jgi:predicted GIY-YIG superfamily endonuclease